MDPAARDFLDRLRQSLLDRDAGNVNMGPAAPDFSARRRLHLCSSDLETFKIRGPVAAESKLLKRWMSETVWPKPPEGLGSDVGLYETFRYVHMESRDLRLVIEFCKHMKMRQVKAKLDRTASKQSKDASIADFLNNLDYDTMMSLHEAACYMEVEKLKVATSVKLLQFMNAMTDEDFIKNLLDVSPFL